MRPEVLQGLEGHPGAPQTQAKETLRSLQGALGDPQGRPKSAQEVPKSAKNEPKSTHGRPRERKNREKVTHRGEKSEFEQRCSATRPCRCAEHFGPLQTAPKSIQNGSKCVLEPLGRPLWSILVAQERLWRPRRPIWIDSKPLKCLQRSFP